jgi:hypothetical protein
VYTDARSSLALTGSTISRNEADGGTGAAGFSDGQGVGGGLYITPGSTVHADHTKIKHNHASTSDNDVFGDLG